MACALHDRLDNLLQLLSAIWLPHTVGRRNQVKPRRDTILAMIDPCVRNVLHHTNEKHENRKFLPCSARQNCTGTTQDTRAPAIVPTAAVLQRQTALLAYKTFSGHGTRTRRKGNDKQTQQRGSEYARKSVCSDKHAVSPRNENCLRGLASPVDFVQTSQTRRAYDRIGKWGSANAHRQEIVSTNNICGRTMPKHALHHVHTPLS